MCRLQKRGMGRTGRLWALGVRVCVCVSVALVASSRGSSE
jgi:biotin-(acetyl-CoA carboxylase) ligase